MVPQWRSLVDDAEFRATIGPPDEPVQWSQDLSVQSATLDLHHQILVGCLNRMIRLRRTWRDSLPAVRRELSLIINYCKIHFFIEEAAMMKTAVPAAAYQRHRAVHRRILARMADAVRAFHADPLTFPFDRTLHFLRAWLVHHILEEDKSDLGDRLADQSAVEAEIAKYRYAEICRKLKLREESVGPMPETALVNRFTAVVHGDPVRRAALVAVLEGRRLHVSQAPDVASAEGLVDAYAPELLFLDWSLPAAKPFARYLYCTRNTAVVACHAGDPAEILDVCEIQGVAHILPHPGTEDTIVQTMHEILDAFVPLRALVLERAAGGA
ncbi:hemerythrin domain-containing protein [Roseospira navarrensis]|nr:hemerythrin domain-containing protein [Roseospira navarrensis]